MKSYVWRIGCIALILSFAFAALAQDKAMYQAGTVTDVKAHQPQSKDAKSYDVSIKVGNIVYVVLATPQPGSDVLQYKVGLETTVFIDGKNMKVNDITGKTWIVPILRQKDLGAAGK